MYGYVQVYRPDLRFREYEVYRSHYCGLCHTLQQRCNAISRLTLSYDFTFLSLLLDALYEPETDTHKQRCFCGIGKNATVYHSAVLDYVADMHLFFAYLHCKDDWNDEHSIPHAMLAAGIKAAYRRICNAYPQKTAAILEHMQQLTALEQQQETQFALPAACFGKALAESFCMEQSDVWNADLRHMGYHLGTFIYVLDAYDDLQKDRKHHTYNPFQQVSVHDLTFHQTVKDFLQHAASEAAAAFERLPILQNADLLRNLLYAGIWQPFLKKQKEYQTAVNEQQNQESSFYVKSL